MKKTVEPILVTDHAVLRYLERAQGFDIEAVRRHIAKVCEPAVRLGARTVIADGLRFECGPNKVVTCVPASGGQNSTRRAMAAIAMVPR